MPYRYSKNIVAFLILGCGIATAAVEDDKWLKESKDIIDRAAIQEKPEWLNAQPTKEDMEFAREVKAASVKIQKQAIVDEAKKQGVTVPESIAKGDGLAPGGTVYMYISFSMPPTEIKAVMREASETGAIVILRGMKKGTNIKDTSMVLAGLAKEVTPRPQVIIDPRPYLKYNITVAPAMTLIREGKPALQARGIYSVRWLKEKDTPELDKTDLGSWGTTYTVEEKDLIEDMKGRVAQVDWEKKKENAYKTHWQKKKFLELPYATKDMEYEFDPTITVTKDIVGTSGEILAHKGQRLNPLDMLPFTKKVFVFDATNKKQVAYVKEETDELKRQSKAFILITTKVDGSLGWKAFEDIEALYQRPLYLLNDQLKNRFNIEKVPTTIWAEGRVFIIKEKKL